MEYVHFIAHVFTQNKKTAPIIDEIGAYPSELKAIMNVNYRQ